MQSWKTPSNTSYLLLLWTPVVYARSSSFSLLLPPNACVRRISQSTTPFDFGNHYVHLRICRPQCRIDPWDLGVLYPKLPSQSSLLFNPISACSCNRCERGQPNRMFVSWRSCMVRRDAVSSNRRTRRWDYDERKYLNPIHDLAELVCTRKTYFFIIIYRSAFPSVWSSFSNWNDAAVSDAPGSYTSL